MKSKMSSKVISLFLVLLVLVSIFSTTTVTVNASQQDDFEFLFGDMNGDGTIDFINDCIAINGIRQREDITEEQKIMADVNGDGTVDYSDVECLNEVRQSGDFYALPIYDQLTKAGYCGIDGTNVKYMLKKDGALIIFGEGKMASYSSANYVPWYAYRTNISRGEIKSGVTSICNSAFYQSYITNVTIPESVEEIGYYAFFECQRLQSLSLPSKLKIIEECSIKRCSRLESITIPNNVEEIQYDAFCQCTNLSTINVPDSLTRVQSWAFDDTAWYKNQPDGVVYIGKVVYKCKGSSPSTIDLRSNTVGIASSAFSGCSSLTKITIPKSVVEIGSSAFAGCNSLTMYGYTNSAAETYAQNNNISFISLDQKQLLSISITKQPTKTTYFVGEALDTTGLQLKLTYDDGSTSYVTNGFTTSGFSSSSAGTKTVTVTYGGKTTTFTVTVKNKSLTSISVSKQPTKTAYFVGEALDTTGLQLKLSYDDGSTSYVTSGFTTSGFSSTSAGTKTVTVTYSGKTTTFTVTVSQSSSSAKIIADTVSANPGDTVNVRISLSNNPGIVAATIKVNFNSNILSLTNVTDAGVLGAQSHKPEYTSPYTLAWANDTATSNYTVNGTIATLTFKVGSNAVRGQSYPIELSYNYNNYEIYDKDLNPVQFGITNGSISVSQEKTLTSISVSKQPTKTTYFVGESLDTTGLQLKLTYDDGSTSYVTSGFTTSGFSSSTAGTKTVTVTYSGKTTTFTVTVNNRSLTSISVSKQPTKTTYFVGEALDTTGLQLKLTYDDGSTSYVTNGFTTSGFSSSSAGTKTVTVTYSGKTTTFTVTVSQSSSSAKIIADTVSANPGDTVNVRISLSNNPGIVAATIKVNFNSNILALTNVTDAGVLGAQSHKPEYTSPYTLAWANDTATSNYTINGTIATLTFKVGNNAIRGQSYPIELSYNYNNYEIYDKDLNPVQFGITNGGINIADAKELSSIYVSDGPSKVDYFVGEAFDTSGLIIMLKYTDGSVEYVTSGYTTEGYNPNIVGEQLITVSYEGKSTTFPVTVKNKSLKSISINKQPTKTTYFVGESLDTSGLQLKLSYDDGSTSYVTSGFSTSGFSSTSAGTKTVTVTYSGKTTTFSVTVKNKSLTSISVSKQPTKTTYFVGESLDTSGLQLKLSYDDGSISYVTSGFTTSGFSSTSAGTKTVTVTYSGKTTTFTVTVNNKTLTSISVSKQPTKITYFVGESLDTSGLQLKLSYDDGSTSYVTSGFTTSGFSSTSAGTKTVSVTYSGKTTTFSVTVKNMSLTSISVSKQPTKTTYYVGESLDTTGLQLKLSYDDGSTSYVTSGFTTSGFSSSSAGTKTVTVTYSGKTTTFTVTVSQPSSSAKIIAETVTANPGDTINVKISLSNNPGIVSATIKVEFDSDVLTLTKVTDAGVLGSQSHKPEYTSPYTLAWANDTATTNYTINGTIATLTFKVGNNAVRGQSYPIELSYNYNNYEIYDKDLNPVQFSITNGNIVIVQSTSTKLLGDVDGDGEVTIIDATLIQRYLVQLKVNSFDSEAADTDGDGDISIVDATFIQRFLAQMQIPYNVGEPIE